ncbi:MAG: hypothetical protein AB201_03225 [Parcubacteria bacterium C7867-006]|nr:MAG: hypothetical protein AB201_03225 [Parcubacteria bacterium C7867-006]
MKDSQGLAATPISRTVNVVSAPLTSSNIFATKIVCDSETDLPNWGDKSGPDIASTTAIDFLSTHPNCHLQKDWKFQWAVNAENPGDNVIGEVGSPWTTFGPTNVDGVTMTSIPATTSMVWFREVMEEGYFKFTGQNTDKNVSAEMYCNTDHLNYDNYDFISNPEAGKTYYCVAFNVINHAPVITLVGANKHS